MQLLTLLTLLLFAERSSSEGLKLPEKPLSILAFLPTEGKSHFIGFKPLLETLVSRGHNVTLVAPFALDSAKRPYRHVKVEKTLGGNFEKYLYNILYCITYGYVLMIFFLQRNKHSKVEYLKSC